MTNEAAGGWTKWSGRIAGAAILAGVALGAAPVWAQAPGDLTAVAETETLSLGEIIRRGGPLMYVLGALSILALALIIYYIITLRESQVAPPLIHKDVQARLRAGTLPEARAACAYKSCALSEVVLAALDCVESGEATPETLKDVVEGEGSRQAAAMQSQIQYLLDVAVIAPMVGLLGTVFGMIGAFNVVALDLAKARPMLLAAGVAEALITTAGGLIVGIPAMAFYAFFRGRVSRLVSHLESCTTDLMPPLLKRIRS